MYLLHQERIEVFIFHPKISALSAFYFILNLCPEESRYLTKILWLNTILQTSPVTHFLSSGHRKEDESQKSTFPHPHLILNPRNFTYKGAKLSAYALFPDFYTRWPARWALVRCTDGEMKVEDRKHLLNLNEDQRVQVGICRAGGQLVVPTAHLDPHVSFG